MKKNNAITSAKEFERIKYLDELLRAGKYFNAPDLLEIYKRDFGIKTKRTIKADVSHLKTYFNAPIEYDASKKSYYYTDKTFFLPSVLLKDSDIFGLVVAQQVMEQFENTPLFDILHNSFEQIRALIKGEHKVDPFWFNSKITVISPPQTEIDIAVWSTVLEALRQDQLLQLNYRRADGKEVERRVEPYNLVNHRGSWYLVCKVPDGEYQATDHPYRTFHLSRIITAVNSQSRFTRNSDFKIDKFIDPEMGISVNQKLYDFEIDFSPAVRSYILERNWHSSAQFSDLDDGGIKLTFKSNQLDESFFMLLSYLNNATIISPPELIEKAKSIESIHHRTPNQNAFQVSKIQTSPSPRS
jgi:predicted DNA-binding transcriptional regulator YafY